MRSLNYFEVKLNFERINDEEFIRRIRNRYEFN
jgi:hypothetical protein